MKRSWLLASVLLVASLASAGAQAQAPRRDPPRPLPAAAPSASSTSPLPAPLTADQVAPPTVDDPLLEPVPPAARLVQNWREALTMVKGRSVDLRVALLDLERAEAQGRVALAAAMPQIVGSANVTQQLIRSTTNPLTGDPVTQVLPHGGLSYGASLSASVPIFNLRAWYGIGTNEQAQKVSQLTIAEQRRVLAAAVADALVGVISAERVAELNRLGLRNALERLALTRRRADLGVANALDVLRVDQDAASARAAIVTGDENLRQAREALGLALGYPEAFGVPRELNIDAFAQESERACPKVGTIDERTDVAVAQERTVLARRGVRDVELSFYPTVDLRTVYSMNFQPVFTGINNSGDRVNALQSWTIAGVLTWNIFDGGARYGNLRDQRAQVEQAELRVEQAKRQAQIEVQRAMRQVEVAEAARKVAANSRDLARETERLTRVSFDLGKGTSLELVDAGRALRQAEIQLALREFDQVQARIRALLALARCDY